MSTPTPTAKGSLETTPFLNLLVYALDHQLTGTLVFEEPASGERHALELSLGIPTKAKTHEPVAILGRVLVELGHLDEATRASSWAEAEAGQELHGRVLRRNGQLDEAKLRAGLREQLNRQIFFFARLPPSTLYGYYDQQYLLARWGGDDGPRARPLELIWRVADLYAEPAKVASAIARLGDQQLKLHIEAPMQRFFWRRTEQAVIDVLRAKPQPFAELAARDLLRLDALERLIYTLAVTRQLDLGLNTLPLGVDEAPSSVRPVAQPVRAAIDFGAPRAPGQSAPEAAARRTPTPSPAVAAEAPEIAAFRSEIVARAERSDETFYELLGVTRDTPAPDVQSVFLTLAKRWHPDRLPAELADLKALASRVFGRMTEASQALADPLQRREYEQKLRKAGKEADELEQVQRVLRASAAFQRAEVLLKRNNVAAAEAEARQALADAPEEADHIALVAWLDSQKPDANLLLCVQALDRALAHHPKHIRALWYRGQLYKRLNKVSRAMRDFRFIVEEVDPKHVDAQREIRIYNMRRGDRATSAPPPDGKPSVAPAAAEKPKSGEGGGFMSKLFKR
jgi:curved DNA-binding protein CbpA